MSVRQKEKRMGPTILSIHATRVAGVGGRREDGVDDGEEGVDEVVREVSDGGGVAAKETWGDSKHRLAYLAETTVIFKDIVQMRDEQWWRALTSGYVTQWEAMHPQKSGSAPPPAVRLTSSCPAVGTTPAEEAATVLKWPKVVCKERRFKIFDLAVGALSGPSHSEVPVLQAVYSSMRGIIRMHNPSVIITVANVDAKIKDAFRMAADSAINHIAFVLLPRNSISKVLWMATLHPTSLPNWNRMRISGNIITQNRAKSLRRLLASLRNTYYVGDEVPISFNMDSRVDAATLNTVNSFDWPHGGKTLRQRIIQGGLIRTQQAGGQQLRPPRWLTPFSLSVCARRLVRKDVGREREEVSVAPSTVVHSSVDREEFEIRITKVIGSIMPGFTLLADVANKSAWDPYTLTFQWLALSSPLFPVPSKAATRGWPPHFLCAPRMEAMGDRAGDNGSGLVLLHAEVWARRRQ
uniref:Uncharacterized protein n=1 Tax=Oryza sativa subsp. japonica TaxID=39947 RepID=Q2QWT2_ORYSJ|nr:hypothetical protein LOC_Os12g08300 [Oryza sativa Japonica Group]